MRWTMTGAKPLSGLQQIKQGIQTLVVEKQGGRWLIDALQNTNAVPEDERAEQPRAHARVPADARSGP